MFCLFRCCVVLLVRSILMFLFKQKTAYEMRISAWSSDVCSSDLRAHASATREFSTSDVTRALEVAVEAHPPPVQRGHAAKLRFAHPGGENPPTFVVHGNRLKTLPEGYRRYLENFFRKRFKLVGTPVRFVFKEGENPYKDRKNVLTERQVARKKRLLQNGNATC